jgi:predicted Co/Zn/Cd cation transporter (cation efflux family)
VEHELEHQLEQELLHHHLVLALAFPCLGIFVCYAVASIEIIEVQGLFCLTSLSLIGF